MWGLNIFTTTYTIHIDFTQKFINHSVSVCVCVENPILYVILYQGENKNALILDIDDQIQDMYLHPRAHMLHI